LSTPKKKKSAAKGKIYKYNLILKSEEANEALQLSAAHDKTKPKQTLMPLGQLRRRSPKRKPKFAFFRPWFNAGIDPCELFIAYISW